MLLLPLLGMLGLLGEGAEPLREPLGWPVRAVQPTPARPARPSAARAKIRWRVRAPLAETVLEPRPPRPPDPELTLAEWPVADQPVAPPHWEAGRVLLRIHFTRVQGQNYVVEQRSIAIQSWPQTANGAFR